MIKLFEEFVNESKQFKEGDKLTLKKELSAGSDLVQRGVMIPKGEIITIGEIDGKYVLFYNAKFGTDELWTYVSHLEKSI
jgi:hypothetical protein